MALRTPGPGLRHAFYPPPQTINTFPPLAQLSQEESDEPPTHDDPRLLAAIAQAPAFIDAWVVTCGDTATPRIPASPRPARDRSRLQPPRARDERFLSGGRHSAARGHVGWDEARAHLHRFYSVTSVFWEEEDTPRRVGTSIGCDKARAHLHRFHSVLTGDSLIDFNPRGSAVAAELVLLLGMNPEIATAAGMGAARFVCRTRPPESQGRRRPLTWRDCVVHGGNDAATATSHGPPSSLAAA